MRDVGLLGGTFDPPHAAHVSIVRAALQVGLVDEVLVVPAGDPWQKSPGTDAEHRLAMARLAFADEPQCRVLDLEVLRPGATYAIDTVAALAVPGERLHYIIGSDTLALLPTWHRVEELVGLCDFIVVHRPGSSMHVPEIPGLHVVVLEAAESRDASTALREEIRATGARPVAVAPAVWEYITAHGLYGQRHG